MTTEFNQIYNRFILELNEKKRSSKDIYKHFTKKYGTSIMDEIIMSLPTEYLNQILFHTEISNDDESDNMDDTVKIYINEISKIPILPKEETKRLFEKLDNYKKQIEKINKKINNSRNSQEVVKLKEELLSITKKSHEIKNTICNHNLRFVVMIAKEYLKSGVPILDLIQEGNIGLMKAIDHFDVKKGNQLTTYAGWWIMASITSFIYSQSHIIIMPYYIVTLIPKVKAIIE